MPPKKDNLIYKQIRLIATRLMQISLLVDDYVYQQKPMTQRSAEAYIKEISAYKDKCYQDTRSLQVIEKLIHCMKEIINEQHELQNVCEAEDVNGFPFQDSSRNDNAMLSPVYSTTDEDLTQLPHYIEVEDYAKLIDEKHDNAADLNRTVTEDFNEEIHTRNEDNNPLSAIETLETYSKSNITEHINDKTQKDAAVMYLLDNTKVIDLCDDEIDELALQNSYSFIHEPEFNIQNAISNLSIVDVEDAFATPFSQEYSQSILDNFYPNNGYSKPKDSNKEEVTLTINNDDVIRTTKHPQPETKIVSFNDNTTKIVLPITNKKINDQLPLNNKPVFSQSVNKEKLQNKYKEARKSKTSNTIKKKRIIAKNKNNRQSDSTEISTTINVSQTEAKYTNTKLQAKKQNKIKAIENKNKRQEEAHKMSNTNKLTLQTPKITKPHTHPKIQPLTKQNTDKKNTKTRNEVAPIPDIYKTTVVNDLSWIENIRFLREIPSEEYEPLTVGEVFWENYTLPENWNEEDFNY